MTLPPSELKDLIKNCSTGRSIYQTLADQGCLTETAIRNEAEVEASIAEALQREIPTGHVGPSPHDRVILILLDNGFLNEKAKALLNKTRSWE